MLRVDRENGWEVKRAETGDSKRPRRPASSIPPHLGDTKGTASPGPCRVGGGAAPAVSPLALRLRGAGNRARPFHCGQELPAGLEGRIALRQDLEAALEEPHVPVPEEIQPLSFPTTGQPLVLRGRHVAPEATSAAPRKQFACGAKGPRGVR